MVLISEYTNFNLHLTCKKRYEKGHRPMFYADIVSGWSGFGMVWPRVMFDLPIGGLTSDPFSIWPPSPPPLRRGALRGHVLLPGAQLQQTEGVCVLTAVLRPKPALEDYGDATHQPRAGPEAATQSGLLSTGAAPHCSVVL